jgi:hypothetical protein
MIRVLSAATLAAFAATAHAAQAIPPTRPVGVLSPVVFAEHATSKDWVKSECDLEKIVENDVSGILRNDGVGGDTTASLASGYVLKVVIERANAQKGGGWSGPKTLSLSAQLFSEGVLQRSTEVSIEAKSWNMLAGSCASLQKASGKASLRISEWLRNRELAKGDRPAASVPASAASAP